MSCRCNVETIGSLWSKTLTPASGVITKHNRKVSPAGIRGDVETPPPGIWGDVETPPTGSIIMSYNSITSYYYLYTL